MTFCTAQNANPSAMLYDRSQSDFRVFCNVYLENSNQKNHLFNTSFFDFMAGISNDVNIGVRLRYRMVEKADSLSLKDAFGFRNYALDNMGNYARHGLTGAELLIRHRMSKSGKWTAQHALGIPLGNQLEQHFDRGFLDWNGLGWYTQIFHNRTMKRFNFFYDIGIRIENISRSSFSNTKTHYTTYGIPVSFLPGIFLGKQNYLYLLTQINPVLAHSVFETVSGNESDIIQSIHFQLGMGYKLFCFRSWELELISSLYRIDDKKAITANLGLRRYFNRILY